MRVSDSMLTSCKDALGNRVALSHGRPGRGGQLWRSSAWVSRGLSGGGGERILPFVRIPTF